MMCVADSVGGHEVSMLGQRWGVQAGGKMGQKQRAEGGMDPIQLAAVPRSIAYEQKPHPQPHTAAATKAQHDGPAS